EPGFGIRDSGFGIWELGFGNWDSAIGDLGPWALVLGPSVVLGAVSNQTKGRGRATPSSLPEQFAYEGLGWPNDAREPSARGLTMAPWLSASRPRTLHLGPSKVRLALSDDVRTD